METSQFQEMLNEFRELRAKRRLTSQRIKVLRQDIIDYGTENGDFTDENGWVKEMEAKGTWQCKNPDILAKQAEVWAESSDSAISTLGKTVMTFLILPPDTTYIHIK